MISRKGLKRLSKKPIKNLVTRHLLLLCLTGKTHFPDRQILCVTYDSLFRDSRSYFCGLKIGRVSICINKKFLRNKSEYFVGRWRKELRIIYPGASDCVLRILNYHFFCLSGTLTSKNGNQNLCSFHLIAQKH